jgi:F0F1-type ATP synthase membrane subunit b/b'
MTTARDFLLPDATLVIECLVFVIVLSILSRAALPRLRTAVDQRQHELDNAQLTIAEAAAAREAAHRDARAITTSAHREARNIINRAQAHHDDLVADGMRKGREEYEWMAGRTQREAARTTDPPSTTSRNDRTSVVTTSAQSRS